MKIASIVANTGRSGVNLRVSRNRYVICIREAISRAMQIGSVVHAGELSKNEPKKNIHGKKNKTPTKVSTIAAIRLRIETETNEPTATGISQMVKNIGDNVQNMSQRVSGGKSSGPAKMKK